MPPREEPQIDLRIYFEKLWEERDKRLDERWHAQEAAILKANHSLEERLLLLNELRGNVVAREEFETKHSNLENRMSEQESFTSNLRGRQAAIATAISILFFVVGTLIATGVIHIH